MRKNEMQMTVKHLVNQQLREMEKAPNNDCVRYSYDFALGAIKLALQTDIITDEIWEKYAKQLGTKFAVEQLKHIR